MQGTVFDTHSVKPQSQLEYWVETVCKKFTNLSIEKHNNSSYRNGFSGKLIHYPIGPVSLSLAVAESSSVVHSRSEIANSFEEVFLVHLQYEGEAYSYHAGQEAHISKGDITLIDCTQPYNLVLNERNEMMVMKVPIRLMKHRVPNILEIIGKKINGQVGMGSVASALLRKSWENINELSPGIELQLANTLIDAVACAASEIASAKASESTVRSAHIMRIKRFINANLANEELSVQTIAASTNVTPGYLHKLFKCEAVTISKYIQNQRLEESSRMLANPKYRHITITEVAYQWGFKDSSHFGHAFKERYAESPRDYRQRMLSLSGFMEK